MSSSAGVWSEFLHRFMLRMRIGRNLRVKSGFVCIQRNIKMDENSVIVIEDDAELLIL